MKHFGVTKERTATDSYGYRAGRALRRHALVFRVLILFLLFLYIVFVGQELYNGTETLERGWGYFLLAVGTAFALRLLLWVWNELIRRRVGRAGFQSRRDYNDYLCHWRKDTATRNASLLAMARLDLCLGRPEQTLQDLNNLAPERLTKEQLKMFYFYQAAAARLDGDETLCADALLRCKAIPIEKAGCLTDMELDDLFGENASNRLVNAVANWGGPEPKHSVLLPLCGALLTGYTAWYYGIAMLLPSGYEYRTAFAAFSLLVIFWGWAILALTLIYKLTGRLWRHFRRIPSRICTGLVTAILTLLVLVFLVCNGLFQVGLLDPEEDAGDGLLIVTQENYLRPERNTDSYYEADGLFLRHYYGPVESGDEESKASAVESETENGESASAVENESPFEKADDGSTGKDAHLTAEERAEAAAQTRQKEELLLIAQYLADSGDLDSTGLETLEPTESAKGTVYVILWSEPWAEDETVTVRGRLVYDRESANGKCDIFVYYEDYVTSDGSEAKSTAILEFYAVNQQSGEVISGDKHSWSDMGSAEYREATGE
ncbi:MAG: hypothetical protein LIO45_02345 [Clostridiales bacterium]|nr:hypothetical protein [Clostridiales bacterium]